MVMHSYAIRMVLDFTFKRPAHSVFLIPPVCFKYPKHPVVLQRRLYEYRGFLLPWILWRGTKNTQTNCNLTTEYLNQVDRPHTRELNLAENGQGCTFSWLLLFLSWKSLDGPKILPFEPHFMNGCRNCWRHTAHSYSETNSFHFKLLFKIREAIFPQFFKLLRWGWGWWWWIAHSILYIPYY